MPNAPVMNLKGLNTIMGLLQYTLLSCIYFLKRLGVCKCFRSFLPLKYFMMSLFYFLHSFYFLDVWVDYFKYNENWLSC